MFAFASKLVKHLLYPFSLCRCKQDDNNTDDHDDTVSVKVKKILRKEPQERIKIMENILKS